MVKMTPNLSILIPTVPTREKYLNRLLYNIEQQIKRDKLKDKVEVIVYEDNFEHSVGYKRNVLTQHAKGKYSVFIDDDDEISDDYCKVICDIIEEHDVDQIGYNISFKQTKWYYRESIFRYEYKYGDDMIKFNGKIYPTTGISNLFLFLYVVYRYLFGGMKCDNTTSQKIPIKTEIAKKIKWNDKKRFQDIDWINDLKESGLINSTFYIDKVMYHYTLNKKNSISGSIYQKLPHNQKIEKFKKNNIEWVFQPITLNIKYVKED